jgi:hypothetical protein
MRLACSATTPRATDPVCEWGELLAAAADRERDEGATDHDGDRAEDRGDRDGVLFVGGGVDRADVQNLLLLGVGEAAVREADDAKDHQDQPDQGT